jgi:hypothetical protein
MAALVAMATWKDVSRIVETRDHDRQTRRR